jgi:imidazole glycerol-phosphate synthase subunit HisH
MAEIVIIDYGMANLRSVQKAFEAVGVSAEISSNPAVVASARRLVLPGVGAFQDAMSQLRETRLADVVQKHIGANRPFLGICLGYQMLFSRSQEGGDTAGLNIFPGDVIRFTPQKGLKIPHMGWNTLRIIQPHCPLFIDLPPDSAFYFVHSYYPATADRLLIVAEADYPNPFPAAIWRGNLFATQFHPEKSQAVGRIVLRNFAAIHA